MDTEELKKIRRELSSIASALWFYLPMMTAALSMIGCYVGGK